MAVDLHLPRLAHTLACVILLLCDFLPPCCLCMHTHILHTHMQWYYAATTLPAEATGAGQDLMLVAGPERCSSYLMEADTRVVHSVPSCKGPTGPCVAVGGKAYLLGRHGSAAVSCFDPHVSCW